MRLLTGRPHRLLGPVIDEIGALSGRGERCMLLVPSQYTLQAELEVMNRLAVPGSFLIDVLSPTRLQSRVFERAGQPDRVLLDERGKGMVLTEVIEAEKENLMMMILMLTDVLLEGTQLLYVGDDDTIQQAFGVTPKDNSVFLPRVMSRKKQIIPMLSALWG